MNWAVRDVGRYEQQSKSYGSLKTRVVTLVTPASRRARISTGCLTSSIAMASTSAKGKAPVNGTSAAAYELPWSVYSKTQDETADILVQG